MSNVTDDSSTGDLLPALAVEVDTIVDSLDSLTVNLGERSSQIQADHREWLDWDPDPRTRRVGDARNAYIERLQAVVYSARLSYILIRDHLVDPEWWTPERWGQTPLFSGRSPGDPDWIIRSIYVVSVQAKNGLIASTFSLTETFMRDIFRCDQVRYGKGSPSFPKMYNRILKDAGLTSDIPLFDVMRHVRNSQHNNGVFVPIDGKDRTISYGGQVFEFRVGKGVATDPWMAAWIVDGISAAMAKVINSEPVVSLEHCSPSENMTDR